MPYNSSKEFKILILVPNITARGGITNYYYTLRKHFGGNILYLKRGAKNYPYHKSRIEELFRIISDYFRVLFYLLFKCISLVQTTTSFGNRAITRDAAFIMLAKFLKKKSIVFYRGWDNDYADQASQKFIFRKVFLKTDASIVLSDYQKNKLLEWGYKGKIFKETTLVDNTLIETVNPGFISNKIGQLSSNKNIRLLFLGRLERTKGIFELVEAFKELSKKYPLELVIAGDGTAETELKRTVAETGLNNIDFTGFVEGKDKVKAYKQADIYVFPSYSEGMPNSVLEAMAFGLPVITTRVGGLVDFFIDGVNGFFIETKDVGSIVDSCEKLILSKDLMLKVALNNHNYAIKNFLASDIAKRNEAIFQEVLNT